MIGLLIVIVLVAVPLLLMARLSVMMLARLFGLVSHSEIATRAEFARIREQLLSSSDGAGRSSGPTSAVSGQDGARGGVSDPPAPIPQAPAAPAEPRWSACPECAARVSSAASICVRCGGALSAD